MSTLSALTLARSVKGDRQNNESNTGKDGTGLLTVWGKAEGLHLCTPLNILLSSGNQILMSIEDSKDTSGHFR